jgi:hypothetical protein
MTDWSRALSWAFDRHLQTSGSGGSSGSNLKSANQINEVEAMQPGTTQITRVVPVVPGGLPSDSGTTRTTPCQQVVRGHALEIPSCKQVLVPVGTTGTTGTTDWDPDIEERAAIVEYDAGISRAWAEGFAILNSTRVPSDFSQKEWEQVLDDGGRFLDEWADKASKLGWTIDEVFGVGSYDSLGPKERHGLMFVIGGGEVVAVSDRCAESGERRKGSSAILERAR